MMPGGVPGMVPGMMPGMLPMMNPMFLAMMQQQMVSQQSGSTSSQEGMEDKDGLHDSNEMAMVPSNPMMGNPMMTGNPMLKGNPMMGVNPMMAGNPMFAMMMMMNNMKAAQQQKKEEDNTPEIDPDVQELGTYFNIEDRWIKRLDETMKRRLDTKAQDLAKLYEVLELARSPTGLLTVKIGEMECGKFVGKIKPDKDVERLGRKFKLDEHVVSRLAEVAVRRKATKDQDLWRIEQHLRYCKRPSAMATLLAGKLLEGDVEELPDLREAEIIMEKFRLDEDAKSKLREIVEKRASDKEVVLAQVQKHLETSTNPSSMLCKIARPLIDCVST